MSDGSHLSHSDARQLNPPLNSLASMAQVDGGIMQSFQKHIEDMRSLILCKICLKPFYEPYIISCGHTYCYGCLRSWFGNNTDRRKTKSCPDCRISVKFQPAPNYLLKDLTHMFIDRAELLPEDESVQEHSREKSEAAAQLVQDREGSGLFQGIFKTVPLPLLAGPIRDYDDNVDRCPVCGWELEDGVCAGCGLDIDMHGSDISSDSEGSSIDPGPGRPVRHFHPVGLDSDDDDTENDGDLSLNNEYDRTDDFIDNDTEDDMDGLDEIDEDDAYNDGLHDLLRSRRMARRHLPGRLGAAYREESSEEEDDVMPVDGLHGAEGENHRVNDVSEDPGQESATNYDDSEADPAFSFNQPPAAEAWGYSPNSTDADITAVSSAIAATSQRRRPVVISDDEDDEASAVRSTSHAATRNESVTVDDDSDDSESSSESAPDSASEEDDSDGSHSDTGPIREHNNSDSDGSDESDDASQSRPQRAYTGQRFYMPETDESEHSSDTVQQPPQSRTQRQQKLQSQRTRRSHLQTRASVIDLSTSPRRNYNYDQEDSDVAAQSSRRGRATRVY